MSDNNKNIVDEKATLKTTSTELSLDDLDNVTGGGLSNVYITKTEDISQDTINKI